MDERRGMSMRSTRGRAGGLYPSPARLAFNSSRSTLCDLQSKHSSASFSDVARAVSLGIDNSDDKEQEGSLPSRRLFGLAVCEDKGLFDCALDRRRNESSISINGNN